jgi:hypothetical protein
MTKFLLSSIAAIGVVITAAGAQAGTNLIVNGGFENPVIGNIFFQDFSSGLPSWTITTNTVDVVYQGGTPGGPSPAFEGIQYLDLVGYGSTGGVSQTFATVPGHTYDLSFAYSNNPWAGPASASADFSVDGLNGSVTHSSAIPTMLNWDTYSGSFVATSTSATLAFTETVGCCNAGVLLDAVVVSGTVPEPPTWAMMLLGFAGLAGAGYRASRKTVAVAA